MGKDFDQSHLIKDIVTRPNDIDQHILRTMNYKLYSKF